MHSYIEKNFHKNKRKFLFLIQDFSDQYCEISIRRFSTFFVRRTKFFFFFQKEIVNRVDRKAKNKPCDCKSFRYSSASKMEIDKKERVSVVANLVLRFLHSQCQEYYIQILFFFALYKSISFQRMNWSISVFKKSELIRFYILFVIYKNKPFT